MSDYDCEYEFGQGLPPAAPEDPEDKFHVAHPFPVDPEKLVGTFKKNWLHNRTFDWPKPGDIRFFSPNVQPARISSWPDASGVDQESQPSTTIVDPTSSIVIISIAPDNLGNDWCYVASNGRMGWVMAAHTCTEEHFRENRHTFRI